MARPRKLISAQDNSHLTKEQRLEREKEEELLYNYEPLDVANVPQGITKEGYLVWEELAPKLATLPISALDSGMVTIYCNTFAIYSEATQALSEHGLLTDDGKISPYFKMQNESAKTLKSIASSLGLSIDSRMRLVIPEAQRPEPKDMFGDML